MLHKLWILPYICTILSINMSKKLSKAVSGHKNNQNKSTTSVKPNSGKSEQNSLVWPLLLIIITFGCFYNTFDNQFVNWDDDKNFYEHPAIQFMAKGDFWQVTKYIFTHNVIGNYNPLANWTFAVEKMWFGFDKPMYWHANNVILHVICTFLVYRIGLKLGLNVLAAFILALLFGIHPMRVESVAWVTERKDVLFGAFYLAAISQYISYVKDQKNWRWLLIFVFFILSLFSKIQAVSLPLSLLAVDYYMKENIQWNIILNKIPLFILSLIFGLLGIYFLKDFGSLEAGNAGTDYHFIQRVFIGAFSFIIYLVKSIVPYRMSPLYPYPAGFPWYYYVSIVILPITLYVLWWAHTKKHKALFFGISFFIVNIIFLLQILAAGQGYLADRFTYIAYFGLFFIMAFYIQQYIQTQSQNKWYVLGPVVVVFLVFAKMTTAQNTIWKDSGTMWSHVIKYYQNTTTPYGNRANFYRDKGMYKEAMADYNKTISLKDEQPQAYNSRARLFFTMAKGQDTLLLALKDYNKAIEYEPDNGEFYTNRGATYARLGNINQAISDLTKGIELKPDHDVAYLNRSIMYQQSNRVDLAIKDIDSYLKLRPNNGDMWYEKGRAHRILSQNKEALDAYNKAISLDNSKPLFYYERSKTNFLLNNKSGALSDYQKAMGLGFKIPQGDTYPNTLMQ